MRRAMRRAPVSRTDQWHEGLAAAAAVVVMVVARLWRLAGDARKTKEEGAAAAAEEEEEGWEAGADQRAADPSDRGLCQ